MEVHSETKHGSSPLHDDSISNRHCAHADALKCATYPKKTPDTFVSPRAFRQDTIDRIWAQYGQRNREFANRLIDRVTRRMSPDHVHELQLLGPDAASNLRWLDRFTNEHIGMRQIWPQIRPLPQGTPIRIVIE